MAKREQRSGASNAQIDKLGDALREGPASQESLRLLDEYRRSFGSSYEDIISILRDKLQLEPTGRPAKSTSSIRDKLRREKVRLSQMQDIAGCRVIVPNGTAQNRVVEALKSHLTSAKTFDRRESPSHGYRAVHIVAHLADKPIEIQIRSELQHVWAEVSEKLADVIDPAIKYGGGPEEAQTMLRDLSKNIVTIETIMVSAAAISEKMGTIEHATPKIGEAIESLKTLESMMAASALNIKETLWKIASELPAALLAKKE